jgi:CHAT domain-containing protein
MPRTLLAEYFMSGDLTLLFLVRADYEQPAVEAIDLSAEAALHFAGESFGGGRSARSVDLNALQERFGPLVAPIADHCDEGDIVWFVPHGPLHYLPLHALTIGDRYLIERNPVCYAPSASVMKYCKAKRTGRRERALVAGDSRGDLAHAREEAVTVAGLFGARPYLREEATKATIRDLLTREGEKLDVVHLACHGRFEAEDALRSGILLAPGADDAEELDATLTAEELLTYRMRADLVTLSACDSGVNEQRPGDELIGLTRSLIYAGTPSVIVSLWHVDDLSASLLMRGFYRHLLQPVGAAPASKAHCLQAAQLEVMRCSAREVIADCTERLTAVAAADPELRMMIELELVSAYAAAGDLDQAIQACDAAARLPVTPQLTARAARMASVLRFKQAARGRRGAPSAVDYEVKPFQHPAHWAPFILVGDWE